MSEVRLQRLRVRVQLGDERGSQNVRGLELRTGNLWRYTWFHWREQL